MGLNPPPPGDSGDDTGLEFNEEQTESGVIIVVPTMSSIMNALKKQRTQRSNQLRRQAERSLRSIITATVRIAKKTASVTSKPVLNSKIRVEQKTEIVQRTTPTVERQSFGTVVTGSRPRTDTEDTGNLAQRQTLSTVSSTFNRVSNTTAAITPNRNREEQEIEQATIKLQRRCNHNFIPATGECQFCKKNRSVHV